ncbi:MAG TPA: hypothetical protein VIY29_16240 [Ktedonobacteraceae bacterium]
MVSIALPLRIPFILFVVKPFICSHSTLRGREERVFFADPQTQQVRSLPLAWTNLALPDPFVVVAAGKAVLRFSDVQQLTQFLKEKQTHPQEDH